MIKLISEPVRILYIGQQQIGENLESFHYPFLNVVVPNPCAYVQTLVPSLKHALRLLLHVWCVHFSMRFFIHINSQYKNLQRICISWFPSCTTRYGEKQQIKRLKVLIYLMKGFQFLRVLIFLSLSCNFVMRYDLKNKTENFVVLFNTVSREFETNMVIMRIWRLAKFAWYDVTLNPPDHSLNRRCHVTNIFRHWNRGRIWVKQNVDLIHVLVECSLNAPEKCWNQV